MLLNLERAKGLMDENGLDGLLATTLPNVFYLSGLWSFTLRAFPLDSQTYALVTRDKLSEPVLIVHTGELGQAITDSLAGAAIINHSTYYREAARAVDLTHEEGRLEELGVDREPCRDALEALVVALHTRELTGNTIGFDENGMDPRYPPELMKRLPGTEMRPAAAVFRQIRMVKTAEEIERLRGAVKVTETAIRKALDVAREGLPERELAKEFKKSLIDQGAELLHTSLRTGRHTVFGISQPGVTPLSYGDRIWFDVGCRFRGYATDIGRTYFLGDPGERAKQYYQALLEGEDRGLETIRAGAKAQDVFHATVSAVRAAGIPHFRRNHVGHGIGIDTYDLPLLAPGDETVLEEGMVLNIEPPYYEIGFGALLVEDTMVVTKNRPELLTTIDRALILT